MKKILNTITLILLAAYVVTAAIAFTEKPKEQSCQGIQLKIRDSLSTGHMTIQEITALLKRRDADPTGRPLDEVHLGTIERVLEMSPLIRNSECYKTIGGHVVVDIECRQPILHIMPDGSDSYFIDEEGEVIEHLTKAMYLPIATGHITRQFAQEELLTLAQYLHNNELWNAQIEQIHVTARGEIELTPRVGNHVIVLGRSGNYAEKFDKLQKFYEKGLSEVGWNRYSRINIDYNNQVIATTR